MKTFQHFRAAARLLARIAGNQNPFGLCAPSLIGCVCHWYKQFFLLVSTKCVCLKGARSCGRLCYRVCERQARAPLSALCCVVDMFVLLFVSPNNNRMAFSKMHTWVRITTHPAHTHTHTQQLPQVLNYNMWKASFVCRKSAWAPLQATKTPSTATSTATNTFGSTAGWAPPSRHPAYWNRFHNNCVRNDVIAFIVRNESKRFAFICEMPFN